MSEQSSNLILMIRPASFRMNEQTAVNNGYQKESTEGSDPESLAQAEFDGVVAALRGAGIEVAVFEDDPEADTPDALFPNNWVSFHADGRVGLYPMFAVNRRRERRESLIHMLASDFGRGLDEFVDFTEFEQHDVFLEGTGSLILDRTNRIAYASIGPRTDEQAAEQFCEAFGYQLVAFTAHQTQGDALAPIYHTNVMLGHRHRVGRCLLRKHRGPRPTQTRDGFAQRHRPCHRGHHPPTSQRFCGQCARSAHCRGYTVHRDVQRRLPRFYYRTTRHPDRARPHCARPHPHHRTIGRWIGAVHVG